MHQHYSALVLLPLVIESARTRAGLSLGPSRSSLGKVQKGLDDSCCVLSLALVLQIVWLQCPARNYFAKLTCRWLTRLFPVLVRARNTLSAPGV
ncbi:hypothetical protein BD289DRAFT_439561 [Coniella lustricola]|uniref:Uncharacterized protein n=1 Tax=Coniella lustricola TaxID=2025994 RepID=A0A2T3A1M0_9PEZI|nr:hypothetical protein BD289DRAFT_439561 [Coniella lustricola]